MPANQNFLNSQSRSIHLIICYKLTFFCKLQIKTEITNTKNSLEQYISKCAWKYFYSQIYLEKKIDMFTGRIVRAYKKRHHIFQKDYIQKEGQV
jgi:hypothetical protein